MLRHQRSRKPLQTSHVDAQPATTLPLIDAPKVMLEHDREGDSTPLKPDRLGRTASNTYAAILQTCASLIGRNPAPGLESGGQRCKGESQTAKDTVPGFATPSGLLTSVQEWP
jgi:hypothetical protein